MRLTLTGPLFLLATSPRFRPFRVLNQHSSFAVFGAADDETQHYQQARESVPGMAVYMGYGRVRRVEARRTGAEVGFVGGWVVRGLQRAT